MVLRFRNVLVGNEWKTIELPYDDLGGVLKDCALEPNAPERPNLYCAPDGC